jgi:alkyldihydroxyacetonephosphate synthase
LVKLQKLLGQRFSAAEADRILAAKISGRLPTLVYGGKAASLPDAVVWPESTAEVAEIVKIARHYKVPLIPFGEGSGVLGGITAVNGGIVMDMKRMNRIIEIDEDSLLLTVDTGINGEVLERKLQEKGFTLRHTPQSVRCSTLGGWISCRAAGQFSTKYGKIEDMLCGLQAVLPDGSIYQNTITPRSATDRALTNCCWAQKERWVSSRAVLKIWRLPEKQIGRAFAFSTVEDA